MVKQKPKSKLRRLLDTPISKVFDGVSIKPVQPRLRIRINWYRVARHLPTIISFVVFIIVFATLWKTFSTTINQQLAVNDTIGFTTANIGGGGISTFWLLVIIGLPAIFIVSKITRMVEV